MFIQWTYSGSPTAVLDSELNWPQLAVRLASNYLASSATLTAADPEWTS